MGKLMTKLIRDIRKSLGQFVAVTVVSAIGVALLTGFSVTYASLKNMAEDGYRAANLAGMSAYYMGIDYAGVEKIKAVPGVTDAYGRLTLKASAPDNSSDFLIHTVSLDEKIDVPSLTSDRLPQTSRECMIDDAYARAHRLSAGSTVSASIGGQTLNFTVTGTFNTSEYIYLVEDPAKDPVPDHKIFGLLYLDKSAITALAGNSLYNEVLITLAPGTDENAVKKSVQDETSGYGFGHITLQKDQPSYSQLQSDIDTAQAISDSFPYIFFLVAAAILFISMSRTVQMERGQIGIMKALGIGTPAIMLHYAGYAVLSALAGSVLGNLLGVFAIPPFMLGTYSMLYTFPKTVVSGYGLSVTVSALIVLVFAALAAGFSVRKALKETPAQCMRPVPPKKVRQTLIERTRFWRRISYKNKLILRNILFNKQRAILSSIGIIGCVGVLLCGFGLREAAGDLYNVQLSQMQNFDDMVQLSVPAAAGSPAPFDAAGVPHADAYSVIPATVGLDKDVSTMLYLLPQGNQSIRLDDINGKALALPADGILFPYKLAQQYHVKLGDTVKVRLESALYRNVEVSVRVSGIDVLYLSQDVYASYEYLQSLGVSPYVNGYYVSVGDKSAAAFASGVAGKPNVKSVVSKSNLKSTVESLMGMMDTFFALMTAMSAALALAVIFNISSINIFERRRDIATLKVLGYHKREINSLVCVENFIITALGSVFGLAFGAVIYKYLLAIVVSQDMFFPYKISFTTVALSLVLAFAFTAFANWALRGKTRKIDMVESLKGVE